MSVNPRGIRSPIPAGTLIGRARGHGKGPAELVTAQGLAANLAASGVIAPPGAPAPLQPIATHTVLANPTGSTAAPIATTLPAPAAGLTWTYGASSITITLANDLAALEGLSGTGFAVRTTTDTWAQRTITGTASRLAVTNGDGVAGNPTLDIDAAYVGQSSITTLGTIATGTWNGTAVGVQWGGTGADLHLTGGTSRVLKQTSVGAAVTVAQLATGDLSDIGTFNLSTTGTGSLASLAITGTAGAGFIDLNNSTAPSNPSAGHIRVFGGSNNINIIQSSGAITNILLEAANQTYTLPNVSGTFVTTGDTGTVTNTMLAGSIANAKLVNSSLTIGSTNIALGATSTTLAGLTSVTTTGGSLTGLTALAIRDTSAAFDVTLAATSSTALTAGRTLTLDLKNVAHTLAFGSTANTITFPSTASYTVIGSGDTGTVTNTMLANSSITIAGHAVSLGGSQTLATSDLTDIATFNLSTSGTIKTTNTTAATSRTTGALQSAGGLGVTGATWTNAFNTAGSLTAAAWGSGGLTFAINAATLTDSNSTGTVATNFPNSVNSPTLAASNAGVTFTDSASLRIGNAPVAGTNVTLTNAWSLYVNGATRIGGKLVLNGAVASPTNVFQSTSSNPSGSASATGVMMGLAGAITPVATVGSGNVLIHVTGDCFNTTAIADGGTIQIRTGTGTAPTNGAALTGTAVGSAVTFIQATTADKYPFSLSAIVAGLALNTAIWIDVSLARVTGGTATIENVTVCACEI